ncbi:hypothetical protein COCVIDRAFT_36021 [Bipolaris victoriae FI3]|uniref:CoA transferase n=1 Tax=Bipolaris victoriae (strain FI3) TaxID=930091 RepID=W7EQ19_BIPV3|nr:hypothetical protein COCVIDRAFT_36021 [Bipolaris victoriae FI3]
MCCEVTWYEMAGNKSLLRNHEVIRPLDGITVVSLEHAVAAPFCTRQLADLGARVIKVERPGVGDFARTYDSRVDGLASHFSVEHMKVLMALLDRADVLVQNLAPGASARLGLSYEALKPKNPGLIVCDVSGYGDSGSYREKKSYDLLVQSEAGLLSITGSENEVAKVGISIADISAGIMVEWMSFPLYCAYQGAPPPRRTGASHATIYPYGPFETGGGESVTLGIQNEREWNNFCQSVLEKPELSQDVRFASNSLRMQNREELKEVIRGAFKPFSTAEIRNHPQLRARGRWTEVDTPKGRVSALVPPGVATASGVSIGAVPALGEHTLSILEELGFDAGIA